MIGESRRRTAAGSRAEAEGAGRGIRTLHLNPIRLLYLGAGTRRLMSGLRQLHEYRRQRQFVAEARCAIEEILPALPPMAADLPPPTAWTIERILSTTKDAAAVGLSSAFDGIPVAVLKLARGPEAVTSMRREIEIVRHLTADPRLGELHSVLPKVLACGETRQHFFLLEQALPGVDARRLLSDRRAAERVQVAAAVTVSRLHQCTASAVVVDDALADLWVDQPMRAVRGLGYWHPAIARREMSIEALADELHKALLGRRLVVSWVHGDFSPGNIRVTSDGEKVTGILDWETSSINGLPMLDVVQLVLSTRVERKRCELGDVLRTLLTGAGPSAHELRLLEVAQSSLGGDALSFRNLLVLSWLRHVADNLARSSELNRHRWWVRENVESVLAQV